jgi:hypothetical protein
MHFEELKNIRLLFIGLLEPRKGLLVVIESQISVHKSAGGNVTCFPALLQFREEPKSILSPAGMRIRPDEHPGRSRAAMR